MDSTYLSLFVWMVFGSLLAADEHKGLQPIPMPELIPSITRPGADEPELLPSPPARVEYRASYQVAPANPTDFEIGESTVIDSEIIEDDVIVDEQPVDPYQGVAPSDLGLPCITLHSPQVFFAPVQVSHATLIQPHLVISTRSPVVVTPHAVVTYHAYAHPTVEAPVGLAILEEIEPLPPIYVPGQPVRNRVRARRSGLFH